MDIYGIYKDSSFFEGQRVAMLWKTARIPAGTLCTIPTSLHQMETVIHGEI